jgi:hypothetical protein
MPQEYAAQCRTQNCVGNVFIPIPNPPESFDIQPYPPTGTWPLLYVCSLCSHGNILLRDDFHSETRPDQTQDTPEDEVLWFLEIQCSERDCPLLLRLHTTAASNSDPDDVARTIYLAIEEFRCEASHPQLATARRNVVRYAQTCF